MKSDNQKKYVQNWTNASKIGTDTKESTFITALDSSHDTIDAGVELENSESKSKVETSMNQQKSKHVVIERTVTKHETMEVVSSSSSSVQVSEKLEKVAKSSSEKHESLTEISSNKKVTNTTSKSEQQHFVSKTRSEIPSDSTIEEQIDDFVKSTTEEEAKALLEQISQISASHSAFIFHFVN